MTIDEGTTGRLLVLASAISFGTLGMFGKLVYAHGGDPLTLLFVRFVVAFAVLGAVVGVDGRYPSPRAAAQGVALGVTFYLGQSLSFFEGLERAPAGLVVLLFYVWPLFVTVGGAVFLGEALGPRRVATLAVGLCGVALAVGLPHRSTAVGVALGLASGVFYAGYLLGGKRLLGGGMTPRQLTAVAFLGPALAYSISMGARGLEAPSGVVGWGSLAGVVVLGTVVPTLLLFSGMRLVEAGTASMLSTVEPLCGIVLAYAVLGESLSGLQLVGGALILASVAFLSLPVAAQARSRRGRMDGVGEADATHAGVASE